MSRLRSVPARVLVALTALVTAGLSLGPSGTAFARPSPTPAPTVEAATAAKAAADNTVDRLAAQVATAQRAIAADQARWQVAEQQYVYQRTLLKAAAAHLQEALVASEAAEHDIDVAQATLRTMVRQSYTSGDPTSVETLLVTSDPSQLLGSLTLSQDLTNRQGAVVADLQDGLTRRSAAERAARQALSQQQAAAQAAERAVARAKSASDAGRAHAAALASALAVAERQRDSSVAALARATATVSQQAAVTQDVLDLSNQHLADQARQAPLAPSAGRWTPAVGMSAANRALAWLGTPYSFAGGNAAGPTLGVAVDDDSRNDGHIVGFDCSGLSLYAWAPYLAMDHYATTQYGQVGHVHPAVPDLLAGDMVFWSDNGQASGIGHVAIYLGAGEVIQAPHSGDIVKVTPLTQVEPGYFGATRPLT